MSRLAKLRNLEVVAFPDEPSMVVVQEEGKPGKGVATVELRNESASISRFTVTLGWDSLVPQNEWIRMSDVEDDRQNADAAALQASHYDAGTRTLTTYLGRFSTKLVNIHFNVPKLATSRAGRYELKLTVEKKTRQGGPGEDRSQTENLILYVMPFYDGAVEAEVVTPLQMSRAFRRGKRYQVTVKSISNDWTYFRIVHGGAPYVETACDQEVIAVPPGQARQPQTRSFWVRAKYKPAKKGHFFYGPDELNKEIPISLSRIDAPTPLRFSVNYERELVCEARYVASKGFNPPQNLPFTSRAQISFLPTIPQGAVAWGQRIVTGIKGMVGLVLVIIGMMLLYSYMAERFFVLNRIYVSGKPCEGREGDCFAANDMISISGAGVKGAKVKGITKDGKEIDFGAPYEKPVDPAGKTRQASDGLSNVSRNIRSPIRQASTEYSVQAILEKQGRETLEIQKIRISRPLFGWLMLGDLLSKEEIGPFILGEVGKSGISFTLSTPSVVWDELDSGIDIVLRPEAGSSFGKKPGTLMIGSESVKVAPGNWKPESIKFHVDKGDFKGSQTVFVTTSDRKEGSAAITFSEPSVPIDPNGELNLDGQDPNVAGGGGENGGASPGGPDAGAQPNGGGSGGGGTEVSLDDPSSGGGSSPDPGRGGAAGRPAGRAGLEEGVYIRYISSLSKGDADKAIQHASNSKSPLAEPLIAYAQAASGNLDVARETLGAVQAKEGTPLWLFCQIAQARILSEQGDKAAAQKLIADAGRYDLGPMVGASWPNMARAMLYADNPDQKRASLRRAQAAAAGEKEKAAVKAFE